MGLSLVLAFYAPHQAEQISHGVLKGEAEFVTNLLTQSLSDDLQLMQLTEDDDPLRETLGLLTSDEGEAVITDVWIYDRSLTITTATARSRLYHGRRATMSKN